MKKLIALLLAVAMLLTMTACGGTAKSEEPTSSTITATEAATEPVETEPANPYTAQSEIDIALQNAEAPVFSWPSPDTYTMVLKGLGYKEIDFTKAVIMDERGYYDREGQRTTHPFSQAEIHSIQFLDDIVRVEMSYFNFQENKDEDNWVLYCTKADSIADISGIDQSSYEIYAPMDWTNENADFYEEWTYYYEHFGKDCAYVIAYYYPESGNLYNFVRIFDYPNALPANVSSCLCKEQDMANEFMLDSEFELTFVDGYPVVTSEFTIICDDQAKTYQYRVGMSLAAWAASEFNTDGWILGPNNILLSPDHQYWLECTDWDMQKVGYEDVEGVGKCFAGIRSTAEHKNAVAKSMNTNTVAAYLVDWQTALLSTGFAVVGESATEEQIAYGMYDMGYGCESGEVFKIYMRNVHPSLLADVKVYAVPDNGEKTIPDNATRFAFANVETLSGKDARFGVTMAEATYDITADPNITPDGDFAFAITYQDKLVYWIHMPAVTAAQ